MALTFYIDLKGSRRQANVFGKKLIADVRANTPVDTGLAKSSWKMRVVSSSRREQQVILWNTTDYIQWLERGRGKFLIRRPGDFWEKPGNAGLTRGSLQAVNGIVRPLLLARGIQLPKSKIKLHIPTFNDRLNMIDGETPSTRVLPSKYNVDQGSTIQVDTTLPRELIDSVVLVDSSNRIVEDFGKQTVVAYTFTTTGAYTLILTYSDGQTEDMIINVS